MKSLSILVLAASLFIFSSCSEADKGASETTTEVTQPTTADAPVLNAAPPATTDPSAVAPTNTAPATQPATTGGDVALNPPHGQPNHRCDIAVGAPLNSAPATQPQTIQVQ